MKHEGGGPGPLGTPKYGLSNEEEEGERENMYSEVRKRKCLFGNI